MGIPRPTTLLHTTFQFQHTLTVPQYLETSGLPPEEVKDEDNKIPRDIMTIINNNMSSPKLLPNEDTEPESKNEDEAEDAPQWEFNTDEEFSNDKTYIFCPLPQHQQLLSLFTCHFCHHPFFPTHSGIHQTSAEIQDQSIAEMYHFCKQWGLSEVWAYMWSSWYSPQMWRLWAQSSDGCILSHLWTTMMGENHWKQLKHHYLGFMPHPWLNKLW